MPPVSESGKCCRTRGAPPTSSYYGGLQGCRREESAHRGDERLTKISQPRMSWRLLPATTLSTEPYSSITAVFTLERALNGDKHTICMFLGKDGERRIEHTMVECRHMLNELFRQEANIVLVCRGFLPTPQQVRGHIRERTQEHQNQRRAKEQ